MTNISLLKQMPVNGDIVLLCKKDNDFKGFRFNRQELNYIRKAIMAKEKLITINRYKQWIFVQIIDKETNPDKALENIRIAASKLLTLVNKKKIKTLAVIDLENNKEAALAYAEGLALSNYQFLKYFKDKRKKLNSLKNIKLYSNELTIDDISRLNILLEGVFIARDLVNEPSSYLTASQLAKEIQKTGEKAGFSVEIFEKKKIEALKFGGLLAVNMGSIEPPTFSILEWKPETARNKKPYILIGKGLVFDTGGLSLKPTPGSMDSMKSDMAGAAAVTGAMYAIVKTKLPVHVIGLIPATDNRPGENAYAPQDIIIMHDGTSVEVMNTDAEGRMILADALSFAKQYKPELVIDLATLTGAAIVAVGSIAMVGMGTGKRKIFDNLIKSGFKVCERIVELPLWDEYKEQLKSDVADIKNVGGKEAGSITGGKFLQHFTKYPWIHLDIAGPAFLESTSGYRIKGGTGVGVRLLFDFFCSLK